MRTPEFMKRKWDQGVDWSNLLPPSRPSAYHLQIARQALSPLARSSPIAVLGSTPELRDLCAALGFERVFVLDHSKAFHERVQYLRCYDESETLVLGDWFETLPSLKATFGAILSDLTSGNIPYSNRRLFYRLVAEALMPAGIFIDKILTHTSPFVELEVLDEKYSNLPFNLLTLNHFSCEYFFCSKLVEEYQITDVDRFYDILDTRFKHPVLRRFLRDTFVMTPKGGIWYYGCPWSDLEKDYYSCLRRIASHEEEPSSPYFGRLQVLVSQRSIPLTAI